MTVGPTNEQIRLDLDLVLDDNNEVRAVVTTPDVTVAFEGRKQQ